MSASPGTAEATQPAGAREIVYERPQLYPKQEAAIYEPCRYSFIEAGTKSGKTSGCIVWLVEKAIQGRLGANFWWIAPIYAQTKVAYRRLKAALDPSTYSANESELTITLKDVGTVIWFKSADNPDSLFGEDVFAAVIDEASRVKEEAWIALRSTLTATRGPVRIIGNVKGRKNWFYRTARMGLSNAALHRITCNDAVAAGVLAAEEIADAKRVLPEAVFRELYGAEAADDEGNPFGAAAIEACIGPLSTLPPVVFGWDLASHVDWTVGVGLDRSSCVCRLERFQLPWPETKKRIIAATGGVHGLVDSSGVGDPIVADLQLAHLNVEGFVFTATAKQQLMEGLQSDVQQRDLRFPEGVLAEEMRSFEYVVRVVKGRVTGVAYSAPEGMHDDTVCALALARKLFREGYGVGFAYETALPKAIRESGTHDYQEGQTRNTMLIE